MLIRKEATTIAVPRKTEMNTGVKFTRFIVFSLFTGRRILNRVLRERARRRGRGGRDTNRKPDPRVLT